jgi:hypothetical protein
MCGKSYHAPGRDKRRAVTEEVRSVSGVLSDIVLVAVSKDMATVLR